MPGGPWLLTNTGGQSHIHQLFSTGRAGSGCCTATDTDVADGCLAGIATCAAVTSTGRLAQPAHGGSVAAPICDAQRHAGCHRVAHAAKVAAALGVIKDHLLPVLLESGNHLCATCDRRAFIGSQGVANAERCVHNKRSCGVDPKAATRTVCLAVHVPCVLPTADAVASGVVPLVGGCIALDTTARRPCWHHNSTGSRSSSRHWGSRSNPALAPGQGRARDCKHNRHS
eukprot:11202400-Lingulodinium_polyedra.AAC.1